MWPGVAGTARVAGIAAVVDVAGVAGMALVAGVARCCVPCDVVGGIPVGGTAGAAGTARIAGIPSCGTAGVARIAGVAPLGGVGGVAAEAMVEAANKMTEDIAMRGFINLLNANPCGMLHVAKRACGSRRVARYNVDPTNGTPGLLL